MAAAALVICLIFFGVGLLRGEAWPGLLLVSISLAVAAIPEALPAVVIVALALGAKRLVKSQALVRKLSAVETLGSVTYICTDKTGTLTVNKMTVEETDASPDFSLPILTNGDALLTAMALNNDVTKNDKDAWLGDSTEVGLAKYAADRDYARTTLETRFPRIAELPFDSDRKCMTTLHQTEQGVLVITKGAVGALFKQLVDDQQSGVPDLRKRVDALAERGFRTMGYAGKLLPQLPKTIDPATIETGLSFIGFVGLMDPPRHEARQAVAECREAGIITVMITSDHKLTAKAIAQTLGIITSDADLVMTGPELGKLDDAAFNEIVEHVRVYARVDPAQKLRIISALQARHQFVVMTGDGVNDAPALKNADIGIAMDINGTEVAKEAAHMILLDDNFATAAAGRHRENRQARATDFRQHSQVYSLHSVGQGGRNFRAVSGSALRIAGSAAGNSHSVDQPDHRWAAGPGISLRTRRIRHRATPTHRPEANHFRRRAGRSAAALVHSVNRVAGGDPHHRCRSVGHPKRDFPLIDDDLYRTVFQLVGQRYCHPVAPGVGVQYEFAG